jgi:hypothetical protein
MERMRRTLIAMLAFVLSLPIAANSWTIQPPKGFEGDLFKATFALYGHRGKEERFLCTTTSFKVVPGGYDLVGAGHCVAESGAETFSVAEDVGAPETPVTVIKYEDDKDYDFAIFELKTDKQYPVITLDTVEGKSIGDDIINPNFALGLGKQLSRGTISTGILNDGNFLAQIFGAGGSSGSAVVSATNHGIIGIAVDGYYDSDGSVAVIGMGIEPIDKFYEFMTKPAPAPKPTISVEEFQQKFGKDHPFTLTVQGPNPVFTQGGYNFKVDTHGFELSDEYYYNVPVYIDVDNGRYLLTSTKEPNYSVTVTLLSKV